MDITVNTLYVVGLVLITLFTLFIMIFRFAPVIISALFEITFNILSIVASLLASFENQKHSKYRANVNRYRAPRYRQTNKT